MIDTAQHVTFEHGRMDKPVYYTVRYSWEPGKGGQPDTVALQIFFHAHPSFNPLDPGEPVQGWIGYDLEQARSVAERYLQYCAARAVRDGEPVQESAKVINRFNDWLNRLQTWEPPA